MLHLGRPANKKWTAVLTSHNTGPGRTAGKLDNANLRSKVDAWPIWRKKANTSVLNTPRWMSHKLKSGVWVPEESRNHHEQELANLVLPICNFIDLPAKHLPLMCPRWCSSSVYDLWLFMQCQCLATLAQAVFFPQELVLSQNIRQGGLKSNTKCFDWHRQLWWGSFIALTNCLSVQR